MGRTALVIHNKKPPYGGLIAYKGVFIVTEIKLGSLKPRIRQQFDE